MKKMFLILAMICASSCNAQAIAPNQVAPAPATSINVTNTPTDTLNTCIYKLDNSKLVYLTSKRVDVKSTLFQDYVISNITDVNGKRWSVNPAEWLNFNCTKQIVK